MTETAQIPAGPDATAPAASHNRHTSRRGRALTALLAVIAVTLASAPRPARADDCGILLVYALFAAPPPPVERVVALELHLGTLLNSAPPPPLMAPDWPFRLAPEARLIIGLPGTGFELMGTASLLAPTLESAPVLRGNLGIARTYGLGVGPVAYLYGAAGTWYNIAGRSDAWGEAATFEARFGAGVRFDTGLGGWVTVETDVSWLGPDGRDGGPFVGLRVGYSFGLMSDWVDAPPQGY